MVRSLATLLLLGALGGALWRFWPAPAGDPYPLTSTTTVPAAPVPAATVAPADEHHLPPPASAAPSHIDRAHQPVTRGAPLAERRTVMFESSEPLPPGVAYPEGYDVLVPSGESGVVLVEATAPARTPALFQPAGRPLQPIDDSPESAFVPLGNGRDFSGWVVQDGKREGWRIEEGVVIGERGNGGWLRTTEQYSDFELRCDVRLSAGANTGIAFRFPETGSPPLAGIELQLIDDAAEKYSTLRPDQHSGSLYYLLPPTAFQPLAADVWHAVRLLVKGPHLRIDLDGTMVNEVFLDQLPAGEKPHPLRARPAVGYIGFQCSASPVQFRNIRLCDLIARDETGVGTLDLTAGTGDVCPEGAKITVDYRGRLLDGTQFDSSYDRGEPITVALQDVIAGWQAGIPGMRVGGRRKLVVPAAMAYGDAGVKDLIPPGATLVFEVELRGVER